MIEAKALQTQADVMFAACIPHMGHLYLWEPAKPWAREVVVVTHIEWNGEDFWIWSKRFDAGSDETERAFANDLSRWVQATVYLGERSEDLPVPESPVRE